MHKAHRLDDSWCFTLRQHCLCGFGIDSTVQKVAVVSASAALTANTDYDYLH